ncbi:MAG: hypothetical protein WAM17_09835 [Rhodoplanes sp.]
MSDDDPKIKHVIFGYPGFLPRADDTRIVGLDKSETEEILNELRKHKAGNPHHSPRYRELYEKHHKALLLAAETQSKKKEGE